VKGKGGLLLIAVLTPAKHEGDRDGGGDQRTGARSGRQCLRRFAFMKGLYQVEQVSFDRLVDPIGPRSA
jgi:hypothetical protein